MNYSFKALAISMICLVFITLPAASGAASNEASQAAQINQAYDEYVKSYDEFVRSMNEENGAESTSQNREKLEINKNKYEKAYGGAEKDSGGEAYTGEPGQLRTDGEDLKKLDDITSGLYYGKPSGKLDATIAALESIVKNPKSAAEYEKAVMALAYAYILNKEYSRSVALLEKMLTAKPSVVREGDVINLLDNARSMAARQSSITAKRSAPASSAAQRGAAPQRIGDSEFDIFSVQNGSEAPNEIKTVIEPSMAGMKNASFYKPTGEWTGRLILPPEALREPDGSVLFEVHNSPMPELIGKTLRLRWDLSKPENMWFMSVRPDVIFPPKRMEDGLKNGLVLPMRIGGLSRVSPLESLAGAHATDDIDVMLKNPSYNENSLFIDQEPVQICGSHRALVRFEGPAEGDHRTVVHYNPATGNFDGATEKIYIPRMYSAGKANRITSTTVDIEKSPLNEFGWYIYGKPSKGVFYTEALEPREPLTLRPSTAIVGKVNAKHFFSKLLFKDLAAGTVKNTLLIPEEEKIFSGSEDIEKYIDSCWPVGKPCLVIHLFGWRNDTASEKKGPSAPFGLVTGHFAFGIATVTADPFTGEKRFDIEYRQIYAHNNSAIVSGTVKWHNYMGSLRRGWMYTIPVSDTMIQIPELEPYDINGWKINPYRGLSRLLEIMAATYRTGGGSGIASVSPAISCVQDSHYALYGALMTFEKTIGGARQTIEWLSTKDALDPEVIRFMSLGMLVKDVKDRITILGLSRNDWKKNFDNPLGTRDPNIAETAVRTLLSLKSVFPRDGNDNLIFMAANRKCRVWSILTTMCGGKADGLTPVAPNSLVNR